MIFLEEIKFFDIKDAGYVPKPEAQTFDLMVKKIWIKSKRNHLYRRYRKKPEYWL